MNRRDFTTLSITGLAAACGFGGLVTPAAAQGQSNWVEGEQFIKLSPTVPVSDPKRIEVIEFFTYWCSHCFEFEPLLDGWIKKLPPDVYFHRVPVALRDAPPFPIYQRMYYALESMGLLEQLHRKVFSAIHVDKNHLDTTEAIGDFMAKNGVDRDKFLALMNSFSIVGKTKQAGPLSAAYKLDGTPGIGVAGKFYTSGPKAGDYPRLLAVTDYLIARARSGT